MTLLGATVAWHVVSPSWSQDGYARGTLCVCLTFPGQALSWPVGAQLCCGRLAAVKSRHPDQVVPSLALGL